MLDYDDDDDDDTILYVYRLDFMENINFLGPNIQKVFARFKENGLIANYSKLKSFFIPRESISLRIRDSFINYRKSADILGFVID